jgi:predicted lactoylglutathione lyase
MANHVEDLEKIQIFYSAITSEINNSKQLKKIKALGVEQLAISKH